MFRRISSRRCTPFMRRSSVKSARKELGNTGRRLRVEPLEDRRMLSVTLFVDGEVDPGGDGLAWATAYDNLQSALDDASIRNADTVSENDVAEIWIARGTYRPTAELEPGDPRSASFSLVDGVALFGGFAGTETAPAERDWTTNETVLSGDLGTIADSSDNAYTVVYCDEDITTTVDGVTVREGNADGSYDSDHYEKQRGGGIYNVGTLDLVNATVVENAAEDDGGGIFNDEGTLNIVSSTISNNVADKGGGIYGDHGTLSIRGSIVSHNLADEDGGGVYADYGSLDVRESTFSENSTGEGSGDDGGGLYVYHATAGITDSTFAKNAADDGGGLYVYYATVGITNSTFTENAADDGGGLYVYHATVGITDSTFAKNAADDGGAVYNGYSGELTVTNVELLGNVAESEGGGIFNYSSATLALMNSILAGNVAQEGGGIHHDNGTTTVSCTTLSGNAAERGAGISADYGSFSLVNSIVSRNAGEDFTGRLAPSSKNNLIGLDPAFVRDPGAAGTEDYGDLRLTARSPAVDAGDTLRIPADAADLDQDGNVEEPLPTDLDGNPRVYGESVDIGAYEFQAAPAPGREIPSTIVTTDADSFDLFDGAISLREAVYYAKISSLAASITFVPELSGGTIALGGSSIFLDKAVTIDASRLADGLTVDGNGQSRVLTVLAPEGDPVELVGLTIANGQADDGGGIYVSSGSLGLTNCEVSGNSASDDGGGIYDWYGTLRLTNSTVVHNTADSSGGGIASMHGPATLINVTVATNAAPSGGGVYGSSTALTLVNSIVAANGNSDLRGSLSEDCACNLIGVDPKFARNPGTNGPDDPGDFRLSDESAAIDAGDVGRLPPDGFDLDGDTDDQEPLPIDLGGDARVYGTSVDIGAYEYEGAPAPGRETPAATVTTAEDLFDLYDGEISLREALHYVAMHSLGTTVTFSPELSGSTIVLGGSSVLICDDVTVDASSLVEGLTIDGDQRSSVFAVVAPASRPVELIGLGITGGYAVAGGGIFNSGASLTVRDSAVTQNRAGSRGGGISSEYGTVTLVDVSVSNNHASMGGGVYGGGSNELNIEASTLSNNTATQGGGAVANSGGTLRVIDSTLQANTAHYSGGAIYGIQGTVSVTGSTLAGNLAQYGGGGVYAQYGTLDVVNTTVSGNSAMQGGGIAAGYSATLNVSNATVVGNSALSYGGGIFVESYNSAYTLIANSILAGNSASTGPDLGSGYYGGPSTVSGANNLLEDGSGQDALVDGENGNIVGTALDPVDPRLGPLADNGGPTLTHALLEGSPAVDAGDDSFIQGFSDQRGRSRRYGTVDMGAFEAQPDGFAGAVPDAFDVLENASITFDPRANDLIPEGYTAEVRIREDVAHGQLASNPDGTYTYTPDEGFLGEDHLIYVLDAESGGTSEESTVLFNVLAEGCLLVDTPDDVVNGDLSAGDVSLREAIEAAEPGETIYLSASLANQSLLLNLGPLVLGKDVTLDGLETAPVTIDAGGHGRVLQVAHAVVATIDGLRIVGGMEGSGGGILNSGTLTVRHSTIERNNAASGQGGGIFNASGHLTVVDSMVSTNSAGNGGGIFNAYGTVSVIRCDFVGNSGGQYNYSGGAIANSGGRTTVTYSTFSKNTGLFGGGLSNYYQGTLRITHSTLVDNAAQYQGGGIFNADGVLDMENSTVSNNSAQQGGGICNTYSGNIHLANVTITDNLAYSVGGGCYVDGGSRETIVDNSIIAGNSASSAPDIGFSGSPAFFSASNNLIGDGSGQTLLVDGENGNLVGTAEDPVDPLLGPLADNGGPTLTHALLDESPAIDAGDDSYAVGSNDQCGRPRIYGTVDIGAFEFVIPGDLNFDECVGSGDLDIIRANWGRSVPRGSLRDGDAVPDGVVNSNDLDLIRGNWGQSHCAAAEAPATKAPPQKALEVGSDATGSQCSSSGPGIADSATASSHDAVFANARALAEIAWRNAFESLHNRRNDRQEGFAGCASLAGCPEY